MAMLQISLQYMDIQDFPKNVPFYVAFLTRHTEQVNKQSLNCIYVLPC